MLFFTTYDACSGIQPKHRVSCTLLDTDHEAPNLHSIPLQRFVGAYGSAECHGCLGAAAARP